MIRSIEMTTLPGRRRTIRTKKHDIKSQDLSKTCHPENLDISRTSVRRILRIDVGLRPYQKRIVPLMTDAQKLKRKKFAN